MRWRPTSLGGPADPPVRHGGAQAQGARQRGGREARRQRRRARHPLRRGGGAAGRCRASLRAPGPHDRRYRGGRGARARHRRQQVGSRGDKQKKLKELRGTLEDRLAQVAGICWCHLRARRPRARAADERGVCSLRDLEPARADTPTSTAGWPRRWSGTLRPPPRGAA